MQTRRNAPVAAGSTASWPLYPGWNLFAARMTGDRTCRVYYIETLSYNNEFSYSPGLLPREDPGADSRASIAQKKKRSPGKAPIVFHYFPEDKKALNPTRNEKRKRRGKRRKNEVKIVYCEKRIILKMKSIAASSLSLLSRWFLDDGESPS